MGKKAENQKVSKKDGKKDDDAKRLKVERKQLRADLRGAERRAEAAEAKVEKWRGRAKDAEAALAGAEKRAAKLEKKLAKARTARYESPVGPPVLEATAPVDEAPATKAPAAKAPAKKSPAKKASARKATAKSTPARPPGSADARTVPELRAAARTQGVTGYSRMTKAQLVAVLA